MGSYTDKLFKRLRKENTTSAKKVKNLDCVVIGDGDVIRDNHNPICRTIESINSKEVNSSERVPDVTVERLVSVAIKRGDEIHKGFKSHAELRRSLGDENPYENTPGDLCGFWTSHDRFLLRHQANRVGAAAGQCQLMGREFLSSDVDKW